MSLYKRGPFWWSRLIFDGVNYQQSTKQTSKTRARDVEAEFRRRLEAIRAV